MAVTALAANSPNPAGGAATTGSGRVGNVDVLRAVAALAVLGVHAYALGGRAVPVKAQFFYDVPLSAMASGVWLFFGISGYVISRPFIGSLLAGRQLPELVPYALRRGLRIFPLYWIALTAVIVIAGAGATRAWQFPVHYALLNNLVPGRQEALFSVAWTLTLELLFYAAVPILAAAVAASTGRRTLTAERLAAIVVCSWAASIAFTAVADLQGDGQTGLWLRGSLPAMWQMFCPGILLAVAPQLRAGGRWRRWLVAAPGRPALAVALTTLVAAALLSATAPLRFGIVSYQLLVDASRPLFAVGYGLVIAAAIRARPLQRRWILELGLVSYGIYLLHAVLLEFLVSAAGHGLIPLAHGGALAYLVHVGLLFGLTVPLALASWRWLERPSIALAGRLSERWRGGRAPAPAAAGRR